MNKNSSCSFYTILIIASIIYFIKYIIELKNKENIWIPTICSNSQIAKWIIYTNSTIEFSGSVSGNVSRNINLVMKESGENIYAVPLRSGRNNISFGIFDEGIYTFHIEFQGGGKLHNCTLKRKLT